MMALRRNRILTKWTSAFVLLSAVLVYAAATAAAQEPETTAQEQPQQDRPFLGDLDDPEVGALIRSMNQDKMGLRQRLEWITLCSLGTDYVLGPLGEGPDGKVDTDPLWDFKRADCVTFVEQTYALALARDWRDFTEILRRIRYRGGEIGFATRNHYTVPDWLPANRWLLRDISKELAGERAVVMKKGISKRDFFERSGMAEAGAGIPDATQSTVYVPRDVIPDIAEQLKTGDLVIWITGRPAIFASHVGMAISTDKGTVVRHASQSAEKVTEDVLADYAREKEWLVGMKFARLHARTELMTRPLELGIPSPRGNSTKE